MLGHRVARPSLRMQLWVRTMYSEQGILFSIYSIEDVEDSDHLVSYFLVPDEHVVSIILCAAH